MHACRARCGLRGRAATNWTPAACAKSTRPGRAAATAGRARPAEAPRQASLLCVLPALAHCQCICHPPDRAEDNAPCYGSAQACFCLLMVKLQPLWSLRGPDNRSVCPQPFSPGTYQNLHTALAALDLAQNEQQEQAHPGLMSTRAHGGGSGQGGSRGFGGGPQYSDPPRPRLSFVAEVCECSAATFTWCLRHHYILATPSACA